MTREEIVNSMSLQDAMQVFKDTNTYGTMDIAKSVILKALEQKPRWIPVSERLPEDSGNYLIAIADSNYTNGQYFKISWFYPSDKGWSYRNAAVIAWMPLPEPFEGNTK